LDQAGAPADFKFKHHRPVDIEKIKTSKYYSGPIQRAQLANLTVSTPLSILWFLEENYSCFFRYVVGFWWRQVFMGWTFMATP
jgi:hypothetical protein